MKWYVCRDPLFEETSLHEEPGANGSLQLLPPELSIVGGLLPDLSITDSPALADLFVVPVGFDVLGAGTRFDFVSNTIARILDRLPTFREFPTRHVLFFQGDSWHVPECCSRSIVFMPSCRRGSGALPIFYPADAPPFEPGLITECPFDAGFQGAIDTGGDLRSRMAASLESCTSRRVHFEPTRGYFHVNYDEVERPALRESYSRFLNDCRFVLCPRGDGMTSLRFFEALAYGRIPILISDDAKLPLRETIPYNEFIVRIQEEHIESWPSAIDRFRSENADLNRSSRLASEISRTWFSFAGLHRFVESSIASL